MFSLIFDYVLFRVFILCTIRTNLHCYLRNHNHSFVLLSFQYIYWFLYLKIIFGLCCKGYWLWFVDFSSKRKESKFWGKKRTELIRVNLDFYVKYDRCEDISCATNQILQIQRMSENNESTTQHKRRDANLIITQTTIKIEI